MMLTVREVKPVKTAVLDPATTEGSWHLQIQFNGGWASIYDDPNEKTLATEERAWDCARRCYPDTEYLSLMVRVVFIPK